MVSSFKKNSCQEKKKEGIRLFKTSANKDFSAFWQRRVFLVHFHGSEFASTMALWQPYRQERENMTIR
jgi:hypothetical protein